MNISASIRLFNVLAFLAASLAAAPSAHAFREQLWYQEYPELEGLPVDEVHFFGAERTREIVLRREMRITEGAVFRTEDLWRDWERLVDLGIFADVEVDAVRATSGGVLVAVAVHERPWWFIAPILDYDIDDQRITFGYRVRLRNFRGLNQQFRNKVLAGRRDRMTMSWSTPWIGSRRQSVGLDLNIDLPRPDEDELRSNRLSISTTRFIGDYKEVRRGISAFGRLEFLDRDGTHPDGPIEELSPAIGVGFSRDNRNVRIDPSRGSFLGTSGEFVGAAYTNDVSYVRGSGDLRFFRTWKGVVFATRGRTVLSNGEIPQYRKIGIGGANSIRGQESNVVDGNNIGIASLEVRFPILRQRRFSVPVPFVKKIPNVDLRIDGHVFVDAGSAWDDAVGFRNARVFKGGGIGLRIFLPILELARLELAFSEDGTPTLYFREGNLI